MSTDLVHINSSETALTSPGGLGCEDFSSIRPTIMKLVQRTTTIPDAVPGKLIDTLSGQYFDSVQVVPLRLRLTRVLFPPGGELGADPLCRSDDGIVPSPNAVAPQSVECETCDHGPKLWKSYRNTGKKPDCADKYNLLFALRESGLPYYISIGGSSITNLNKLKELIYRDVLVNKRKGTPTNIYDYTFDIKPLFINGKKGGYYILTFQNLRKVEPLGEFESLYKEFVVKQKVQEVDDVIDGEISSVETEYVEV